MDLFRWYSCALKTFRMKQLKIICVFVITLCFLTCSHCDEPSKSKGVMLTVGQLNAVYQKGDNYVAFCDAVKYGDKYYLVFREGMTHAPYHDWHKNGYLKIFSSKDLDNWAEELEIKDNDWDLRDPCFCVDGSNRLHLYYGYYSFETPNPPYKTGHSELVLNNGVLKVEKTEKVDIGEFSNLWLWKVYHGEGLFYGTAYGEGFPLQYVTSKDGIHFQSVSEIIDEGDETSIVDLPDKRKIAVIRSIVPKGKSDLAISMPPYTEWKTYSLNEMIESPESFIYNGEIYVIGRSAYGMSMFKLDLDDKKVKPIYNFFAFGSYGDCGYPGVIIEDNHLDVLYYSVNPETNVTCIYQVKLAFQ